MEQGEYLSEADFQRAVAAAVAAKLKGATSTADALADLLGISKAVAYKRLSSQTYFSARELAIIQARLDIVITPELDDMRPLLTFRAPSSAQSGRYDPKNYLRLLERAEERLRAARNLEGRILARVSSSDLPVFYFFQDPALAAFKLYSFAVEGTRRPDTPLVLSDFQNTQAALIDRAQRYADAYHTIDAVEILSRTPIDNFLRQVQYFVNVGLLPRLGDAERLFDGITEVLNRLQEWIERSGKLESSAYQLFCNENHYTNSLILVDHPVASALYVTFDNPNFIVSEQQQAAEFFGRHFDYLQHISDPVSRVGQLSASRYIGDQTARIERARRRVRLAHESKALDLD